MAEITQTLGFDASDALEALKQLDTLLATFAERVGGAAEALRSFNDPGRTAATVFANIGTEAAKAAEALMSYGAAAELVAAAPAMQGPAGLAATITAINQMQGALVGLRATVGNVTEAFSKLGQQGPPAVDEVEKSTSHLVVTWGTMVRVVTTQLIVRAMSMIRNALEESITAAINFETRLAEIQTIGGPTAGSLQLLAMQVRTVSEAFAKPIEDVAEGYYQILSNQIGDAAQSFQVMREAARLSVAAVSSFTDAAQALSSVINSYRMNASDAADISGKLFAAVEVGRLRLSDIANSLGKVTVLAHEMGISFDEVLASITTLTVTGVKPDEAMTLLANAERGLLKPTKDMQKAFAELGISSGEVGVATYGFQGFLEKLRGTTNGTASEIAKLTANIRIGRGVIGLTGEQVDRYQKNLEAIKNSGGENAQQKADIIINTNAQQVQRELTALRNFFINDFGVEALKVIKNLLDYFGGLVNIVRSFKTAMEFTGIVVAIASIARGVMAVTAALQAQGLSWALAQAGARGLAAAMISIPGVIVIAAITTAVIALYNRMNDVKITTEDLTKKLDETFNAIREKEDALAAVQTAAAKKVETAKVESVQKSYQAQLQYVADLQKLWEKDKENAVEAQGAILANIKSQLQNRLSLITKVINECQQKETQSQAIIKKNRDETTDLILKAQENFVDRQLGRLGDEEKAVLNIKRARDLESQAAKMAQASDFKGSEDLLKAADSRAEKALEIGEARLKEAKTTEEQSTALDQIRVAEREVYDVLQQRVGLRELENKAAMAQAQAAQEEARLRQEQLRDAKTLVKEIEGYKEITKTGDKGAEAARQKAMQATEQLEAVLSRGNVSLEQFLGIQQLTAKIRGDFESALNDRPMKLNVAFKEGVDAIVAPIEARKLQLRAEIKELETASGAKFSVLEGFKGIQDALVKKLDELINALNKQSSLPQEQANMRIGSANVTRLASDLAIDKNQSTAKALLPEAQAAAAVVAAADKYSAATVEAKAQRLQQMRDQFLAAADDFAQKSAITTDAAVKKSLADSSKLFAELSNQITQLLAGQLRIAQLVTQAPGVNSAVKDADSAGRAAQLNQQFLQFAEAQAKALPGQQVLVTWSEKLGLVTKISTAEAVQGLNSVDAAAAQATQSVGTLTRALQLVPPAAAQQAAGAEPPHFSLGGLVSKMKFFASGGQARGTDTIPAMLGAGEFITNAKSARRFLPQLQAINAGVPPAYEPGGVTNNTTVGDIIVNGAEQPQLVARDVMAAIRREQRRGSGRL